MTCSNTMPTAPTPLTSSGHWAFGPLPETRGSDPEAPISCRPTTTAPPVTYFHGCYCLGEDALWGVNHRDKGGVQSLAALKSIRAHAPDGEPIFVILDNLSAHGTPQIRRWAALHEVRLCFTPTYASWANPIEAHFGVLRQFTMANSNHPNHTVQTRRLHEYLRWRNVHARDAEVLEAQRRERARGRSEKGHRWDATTPPKLPEQHRQPNRSPH